MVMRNTADSTFLAGVMIIKLAVHVQTDNMTDNRLCECRRRSYFKLHTDRLSLFHKRTSLLGYMGV